jgi:hypothetical protein
VSAGLGLIVAGTAFVGVSFLWRTDDPSDYALQRTGTRIAGGTFIALGIASLIAKLL